MSDVRAILANHVMLRHLPADELERLAQMAATRQYKAGRPVFLKGDPGNSMMAVLSGKVRICCYSNQGREVVLNVCGPGEVFGEIALIDGGARTADVFAMDATELLVLQRRDFLPVLHRNPEVCVRLLELLCRRLRATSEQLEDVNFLDLRTRLAKRLLSLSGTGERRHADEIITLRMSQQLLASMIGTSREAVNKQLRSWEESGLIDVGRGWIKVLDRPGLERILEE